MRTIAIVNQKGGSGKTTAAVNLAAALGERGRQVLLIDLDPQATATRWLGYEPLTEGLSTVFARGGGLNDVIVPTEEPNVVLVPGDGWLEIAERRDFGGVAIPQLVLRRALAATNTEADLVIVDTPGRLSLLTVAALAAAHDALVPVPTGAMELEHLADLDDTLSQVRAINPSLVLMGLVAWGVDSRTVLARNVCDQLRVRHGDLLLEGTVRRTVRSAEAFAHRQALTRFATDHPITRDLRDLAATIDAGAEREEAASRATS